MSMAQQVDEALLMLRRHAVEGCSGVFEGFDVVVERRVVRPVLDEVEKVAERFGQPCGQRVRLRTSVDHAQILAQVDGGPDSSQNAGSRSQLKRIGLGRRPRQNADALSGSLVPQTAGAVRRVSLGNAAGRDREFAAGPSAGQWAQTAGK
jgi:hypothetical protein